MGATEASAIEPITARAARIKMEKERAYMVILKELEVERLGLEAGLGLGLERI